MDNHAKNIARAHCFWLHDDLAQTRQDSERCRLTIFYSGRVQGIGFRHAVKRVALGFEVTGTVRNLPDGRVELIAEGRREELEAFPVAIRNEGLAGFIESEQVHWGSAQNEFRGFDITRQA